MNLFQPIAALALISFSLSGYGDPVPAQFSAFDLNAPDSSEVEGVRLSVIYGKSGSVTGIDFTIGLSELDNMKGVSFPLLIGANRINNNMTGLGMGIVNLHEGNDKGVNLGLLNMTNNVQGLNWGLANISSGNTFADVGLVNVSDTSTFQLALFNKTEFVEGLQIGLLNCASNGFLPCFPIFNFAAD